MIESLPLHGGQLRQIAERFGIPVSDLVDFSANINPNGPPAIVLASLRTALDDPSIISSYPDIEEPELKSSIAHYASVRTENVAVANGFVPLLNAALRALAIQKCLLPVPAFVEYRKTLVCNAVETTPYVLKPESNFSYDTEQMLNRGSYDAILLANPQNPSGVLCSREALSQLAAKAAERNIYVLLDEAFIDYVPEESLARETDRFPNLIVFRSVTKFFGMPGLRVAYAVANPGIQRRLNDHLAPWLITTLASRAVSFALEDESYAVRSRSLNRERRSRLERELETHSIQFYPSAANFLLLRVPGVTSAAFWERMIVDHHLVLRNCTNFETLSNEYFRVAVRNDLHNARFLEAIARVPKTCNI